MAESARIGFQSYRAPAPDPRYQNADFRTSQAKRYLGFCQGNVVLTCEEHDLIPRLCYSEIRQEQAWNALTRVEQCMFKISDSFFPGFLMIPQPLLESLEHPLSRSVLSWFRLTRVTIKSLAYRLLDLQLCFIEKCI